MIIGAIVGATGVGKTQIGIEVARRLGAEIISVDSRQIYQGMAIGTAQPTPVQLAEIPHHLVGFLSPLESYSVASFVKDVHRLLRQFPDQKFLLVGGTGLYLQALMEGLSVLPPLDEEIRSRLMKIEERRGLPCLYKWAMKVDPIGAVVLKPGDSHRIIRCLEVFLQTGKPWSDQQGSRLGGINSFPVAWLDRDRADLYKRIDQRVESMLSAGWQEEVRDLCTQIPADSAAMQSLGYRSLIHVIAGTHPLRDVILQIQQETRNFAKRQLTWFRNKTPSTRICLTESGEICEISAIEKLFQK